jgi:pimeloyl-ACP methyl ester carboxylesterase
MAGRVGGSRDPEAEERLFALYDALVDATWPVSHEELDLPTSFGCTHVRRSGPETGEPLVLLHPTTASSASWYRLVSPLAEHHPLFAIDTIGTAGRSVQTRPIESVEELSMWLDEVLDGLRLDSLHLVGFSEGGWLALVHAAKSRARERLASLVLLEPGGALHTIPPATLAKLIGWGASIAAWPVGRERRLRALNAWLSPGVELTEAEVRWALTVFRTFRQHLPNRSSSPT